ALILSQDQTLSNDRRSSEDDRFTVGHIFLETHSLLGSFARYLVFKDRFLRFLPLKRQMTSIRIFDFVSTTFSNYFSLTSRNNEKVSFLLALSAKKFSAYCFLHLQSISSQLKKEIDTEKMKAHLKAILFDCDGIIADTEPLHLAAFKQTLADEGIHLTDKQYYEEYLALDDRGCFKKAYSHYTKKLSARKLAELIARKSQYFEPVLEKNLKLLPGVAEFIKTASQSYPLAIA